MRTISVVVALFALAVAARAEAQAPQGGRCATLPPGWAWRVAGDRLELVPPYTIRATRGAARCDVTLSACGADNTWTADDVIAAVTNGVVARLLERDTVVGDRADPAPLVLEHAGHTLTVGRACPAGATCTAIPAEVAHVVQVLDGIHRYRLVPPECATLGAEAPLDACTAPAEGEIRGFLLVRDADVVLSTRAGELQPLDGDALDAALRERAQIDDRDRAWSVLAVQGVAASRARDVAARAVAAGLRGARVCAAPAAWRIGADGSVTSPVTGLGLGAGGPTHAAHGRGRSDYRGYGDPTGGFTRHAAEPRVAFGRAEVGGGLAREVVERVVHRHVNEVRFCYESALAQNPRLAGAVTVAWTVGATGTVTASHTAQSTVGSASVETCLASAVRRWTFPAPEHGHDATVEVRVVLTTE